MRSLFVTQTALSGALALATLLGSLLGSAPAAACGGFFCSSAQPVNQAAERIIFADNGDGTITAVIQIMYEGPSESFSWLLPIATVPEPGQLEVASDIAFDRLQQATNPQFNLNTVVEGRCGSQSDSDFAAIAPPFATRPGADDEFDGVSVAASGVVGRFDWVVLSLDPALPEPADAAVTWLTENGYDVPSGASNLLGPYLSEAGMHLLALKLVKGSSQGSIRPLVLRYAAELPMIPIKLTAVAANDDMGVMTWVSAPERAVPFNYLSLELNEARVNWFNAAQNYGDVVTAAANDAGGQGFVTEFAGATSTLGKVIWSDGDESLWRRIRETTYNDLSELFDNVSDTYGSWNGFWDAARETITLPEDTSFEDLERCPYCYERDIQFSPTALLEALETHVIAPVRRVQELLDGQPYLTRLYSTLSAADMTADPVFSTNPDLPDVSNIHTADRIIECGDGVERFEASWRIELPQGGVVRGTANDVGTWPDALSSQPPNRRVLEVGTSGDGMVLDDFSADIQSQLSAYNATVPSTRGSGFCAFDPRGSTRAPTAALAALLALWVARRWRA